MILVYDLTSNDTRGTYLPRVAGAAKVALRRKCFAPTLHDVDRDCVPRGGRVAQSEMEVAIH